MARSDEPAKQARKRHQAKDDKLQRSRSPGPRVPGAERKPKVGATKPIVKKPKYTRKGTGIGPAKDEIDRSDRYVRGQAGVGGMSAHAEKMLKIAELKRLIQPLTPSLIQVMSDIAHDKKVHAAVRLDAADRLLNRLFGKPTEKVEIGEPEENMLDDELHKLLNRVLDSVGAPLLEFHDDDVGLSEETEEGDDDAGD